MHLYVKFDKLSTVPISWSGAFLAERATETDRQRLEQTLTRELHDSEWHDLETVAEIRPGSCWGVSQANAQSLEILELQLEEKIVCSHEGCI